MEAILIIIILASSLSVLVYEVANFPLQPWGSDLLRATGVDAVNEPEDTSNMSNVFTPSRGYNQTELKAFMDDLTAKMPLLERYGFHGVTGYGVYYDGTLDIGLHPVTYWKVIILVTLCLEIPKSALKIRYEDYTVPN